MLEAETVRYYAAMLVSCLFMTTAAVAASTDGLLSVDVGAPAASIDASTGRVPPTALLQNDDRRFVANNVGISALLDALSGRLHRPIIVSEAVRRKRLTGEFDLAQPMALLQRLEETMSLLWYDDGSSVYVYDNSEIKNAVASMQHVNVRGLRDFVRESRLYDSRFPVRGDDFGYTFYVTGAPVYVNLILAAARFLDEVHSSAANEDLIVRIVQLHNSFVADRQYMMRDKQMLIPGIATVLRGVFDAPGSAPVPAPAAAFADAASGAAKASASNKIASLFSLESALPSPSSAGASGAGLVAAPALTGGISLPSAEGVRAVAYPDTNSVILVGRPAKVEDLAALIRSLDIEKRQVELSLWIIDIRKSRLDQLGVDWEGALNAPGIVATFNNQGGNVTTLDGTKFLASVAALSRTGDATVVSRPILLTQENVPAHFDSNQTFYAKLIGERTAQLDHVTYGTLISVLPRLTLDASQVEMIVDIEDGNADSSGDERGVGKDSGIPLINRTQISTVARVRREMSLLVGGNTRDRLTHRDFRIPGLADIPLIGGLFRGHSDQHDQVVRVFLLQPRLLRADSVWADGQSWDSGSPLDNATLRSTVQMLKPFAGGKL